MFVSLRIHPMCPLSCAFIKKHGIVFTCSYPLPVSFSCVYFVNFPLCEPGKFVKGGYQLELSTLVNSVAISKLFKVAVTENVHKEAAFFHSLLLFLW